MSADQSIAKTLRIESPDAAVYALRLGDDALIIGQRLSEWCGHGPQLEIDIALTNFALDLIGQARLFLAHAGELEGQRRDEDALAMGRDAFDFVNCLLVEQPNGDFAHTVTRQLLFSAHRYILYTELQRSADAQIAAIAEKAVKETAYHLRFAADWTRRLGDGTDESRARMIDALDALWRFTPELFHADALDARIAEQDIGPASEALEAPWRDMVEGLLTEAGLEPPKPRRPLLGGREGRHTEHLGHLLSHMQFLQRAYPGASW